MSGLLSIAVRSLLANRARSLILGSAILLVTAVLVLVLGLSKSFEEHLFRVGTALYSGHINVAGFHKVSPSSAAPVITGTTKLVGIVKEVLGDEAVQIVDRVKAYGKIISNKTSLQVPMFGIAIGQEQLFRDALKLSHKNEFNAEAGSLKNFEKPGTIILFESQAKKLDIAVGDNVTLSVPTMRNINNTLDLRVVAVVEDMGALSTFSAYLTKEDTRTGYQMDDEATGQIMIYLRNLADLPRIENKLRKAFADRGYSLMEKDGQPFWMKFDKVANEPWIGEKLDITTWEDELAFVKWITQTLNGISILLVSVILVSIALGITNALWMAVRERTAEIGTLRAIGMQRGTVLRLFLLEALLLSLFASLAGIAVACATAVLVNLSDIRLSEAFRNVLIMDRLTIDLSLGNLALALLLVTSFSVLGAIFPARRAGRLQPVVAMNRNN